MRIDFYSLNEDETPVRVFTLGVRGGLAVRISGDEAAAEAVLTSRFHENPGQSGGYSKRDGKKFLAVLPRNFHGTRFFARRVKGTQGDE